MPTGSRFRSLAVQLAAVVLGAHFGFACADEGDPPGRAARLSDLQGSISMQPAGVSEWVAGTVNRPLTTGDKIWSDHDSRAELDIGAAVMRLGANTGFAFLNLDDYTAQMQLSEGTLIVRVRELQPGQIYEVDTPNLAVLLQQPGEYRVEVNEAGDYTVVKVSEGAAQASGGGHTIDLRAPQAVSFSGTDTLAYQSETLGAPDDLDDWSTARERQLEDSGSRQYVAEDVPGTQDLDNNGAWVNTPEYGYVWAPTVVVVGWAPYRFGHWVWATPWGWTWVDDARWGYVPSHYGRWVRYNSNWCWVPGPRHGHRAVYAPALVGWVGGAASGGASGGVAWFPLGPREVYVPGYLASPAYVRYVNAANTTIVSNAYVTDVYERRVSPLHYVNNNAAALTVVPENVFTSGQRVGSHALPPQIRAALADAQVSAAPPAIVPVRQSVLGPTLGARAARPPPAALSRPLIARTSPPRAPAPFERQIAAIQANGGRALTRADLSELQPAGAASAVRVVAAGPVIGAAAPARAAGVDRSAAAPPHQTALPPPGTNVSSQPNASAAGLMERARALQNTQATSAPRLPVYPPPTSVRQDVYTPGAPAARAPTSPAAPRDDRPPSAQPHPPQQRPPTGANTAPANTLAPALPVYHPPSAMPAAPAARPQVFAPPPVHAAPATQGHPINQFSSPSAAHPVNLTSQSTAAAAPRTSPPGAQGTDPRAAASHGDRDSRDRLPR